MPEIPYAMSLPDRWGVLCPHCGARNGTEGTGDVPGAIRQCAACARQYRLPAGFTTLEGLRRPSS